MTAINPTRPTAIDLFAGAGGLGLGLTWAGVRVLAANELEPRFADTYELNHPETQVIRDSILEKRVFEQIVSAGCNADLVVGGPPCQGFSTVGSKRESDPRNSLFSSFLAVVKECRPKLVLFENVAGFRRMYAGKAFHALTDGLRRLDYAPYSTILNAAEFGVPQHRLRTFVVGVRSDQVFIFPEPTHSDIGCNEGQPFVTLRDALSDLPLVEAGESAHKYRSNPNTPYQERMRTGANGKLLEHVGPTHGTSLLQRIRLVPPGGSVLDLPEKLRPKSCFANTYARLWWDRPSTTITRNLGTPSSSRCIHPQCHRGLTTREGTRLQSFPDTYGFIGSRSEKNLQIGNAVPPLLAAAVGRSLVQILDRESPPLARIA